MRSGFKDYIERKNVSDSERILYLLDNDWYNVLISKYDALFPSVYDCDICTLETLWRQMSVQSTVADIHAQQMLNAVRELIRYLRKCDTEDPFPVVDSSPNETAVKDSYVEGLASERRITYYERNAKARQACIRHYGCKCYICGFDFEKFYGKDGEGFIEVHHIEKIASTANEHVVNPIVDLRPLCSNCHSMVHHANLDVEQMRLNFFVCSHE